jgi:hypothetical protein
MKLVLIVIAMVLIPAIVYAQSGEEQSIVDKFRYTVDEYTGRISYYPETYNSESKYAEDNVELFAQLVNAKNFLVVALVITYTTNNTSNKNTAYFVVDDNRYTIVLKEKNTVTTPLSNGTYLVWFVLPLGRFSDGAFLTKEAACDNFDEILEKITDCKQLKIRINNSDEGIIKISPTELGYIKDFIKLFNTLQPLKEDIPASM